MTLDVVSCCVSLLVFKSLARMVVTTQRIKVGDVESQLGCLSDWYAMVNVYCYRDETFFKTSDTEIL
jgi:hypothetical protein